MITISIEIPDNMLETLEFNFGTNYQEHIQNKVIMMLKKYKLRNSKQAGREAYKQARRELKQNP